MLLLMVLVGLIATFLAGASRGSLISLGMAVSVLALALPFLIFSCVYWLGVTVAPAAAAENATGVNDVLDSGLVKADEQTVVESSPK
jgi:hypothetical protein